MRKIVAISILFITLYSCDNKYPDFEKKESGVYMKLLSFEDEEKEFDADFITSVSIDIMADNQVVYKLVEESFIIDNTSSFNFIYQHLNEGDSAQFMVSTDRLKKEIKNTTFENIKTDYVEIFLKIHKYFNSQEITDYFETQDKEMIERLILNKYLTGKEVKNEKGFYVTRLREGTGENIKKGDVIQVNYKGYFLNGLEFDNQDKKTVFSFTYGTPGQMIKGLDIAIKDMKEGEKSKIIIPSQLAFGEGGSTTQIIPPYTTVVYELEIINVK